MTKINERFPNSALRKASVALFIFVWQANQALIWTSGIQWVTQANRCGLLGLIKLRGWVANARQARSLASTHHGSPWLQLDLNRWRSRVMILEWHLRWQWPVYLGKRGTCEVNTVTVPEPEPWLGGSIYSLTSVQLPKVCSWLASEGRKGWRKRGLITSVRVKAFLSLSHPPHCH